MPVGATGCQPVPLRPNVFAGTFGLSAVDVVLLRPAFHPSNPATSTSTRSLAPLPFRTAKAGHRRKQMLMVARRRLTRSDLKT